ncbi:MAG: competence/damage-inducible protein A [Deltaproteobacteria bacterium]|nr:competence/damage-inducible protein A [Deltaproteobacteria bacterium]
MAIKVGVVILGDEVLKAEIREANLAHILPLLNEWGAEVALCAILPDDIPVVVRHLRLYLEEADLLVLTGGIGPTPDDITREAVARVAGVPLVIHPEAKAALDNYYKYRMNEYRLLMAHVPQGATLIPNPLSAAPGFFIARMAVFPGIPKLLHEMFGWLKPYVAGPRKSRVTLCSKAPESAFAGIMREAMDAFPDVSVGSYPMLEGTYRVRVVFRAAAFARAEACADRFAAKLRDLGWEISLREEERGGDEKI